jgi:prepilin peptidase CpaA
MATICDFRSREIPDWISIAIAPDAIVALFAGWLGMLLGPVGILILLFGMAVFGGVFSLVAMLRGQRDYAYVPAITAGFVWYLCVVSLV